MSSPIIVQVESSGRQTYWAEKTNGKIIMQNLHFNRYRPSLWFKTCLHHIWSCFLPCDVIEMTQCSQISSITLVSTMLLLIKRMAKLIRIKPILFLLLCMSGYIASSTSPTGLDMSLCLAQEAFSELLGEGWKSFLLLVQPPDFDNQSIKSTGTTFWGQNKLCQPQKLLRFLTTFSSCLSCTLSTITVLSA